MQIGFRVSEHRSEFVVNDFYELFAGIDRAKNFFALRFFDRRIDKAAHDAEIDVGFEERRLNAFDRIFNIFFGDRRFSAHRLDNR